LGKLMKQEDKIRESDEWFFDEDIVPLP